MPPRKGFQLESPRDWTRARVLHEEGKSFSQIQQETGIPLRTLKLRSKKEGWKKGSLVPKMHEAQQARAVKEFAKYGVTPETVMAELVPIAFAKATDFMAWTGDKATLKPSAEVDSIKAGAISEVSQTKQGVKIRMHSKMDALRAIGQELGMFKTDTEKAVEAGIYSFYRAQLQAKRGKR